ncbi:MAG: PASTA domain-containing protein [Capsulimonadales bacterium]|nr:PASTA domain-containing protein [Capsulimonadales bacterium]
MDPLWQGITGKRDKATPVGLGSVSAGAPLISAASGPAMEIAHILFVDIVGYSRYRTVQQADIQRELQHQLQMAGEVTMGREEKKLIIRPTGDGAALLFLRDVLSPLRCAIQLQSLLRHNEREIRDRTGTMFHLRMGIHTGPIIVSTDLNSQSEVAGEGVNMAQRIMDCGDAGHILLSAEYAEKLRTVDPWPRYLQDIGECQVKHGVTVHLFNFFGKFDGIPCGQPGKPAKVAATEKATQEARRTRAGMSQGAKRLVIAFCMGMIFLGGGYGAWNHPATRQQIVRMYRQVTRPPVAAKPEKKPAKPSGSAVAKKSSPTNDREARPVQASVTPDIENVASPRLRNDAPPETVTIPSFLGMTLEEAQELADERGLRLVRSQRSGYTTEVSEGQIYEQSDAAGRRMRVGKTIYVRVSKGEAPETIATPDPEVGSKEDETIAKTPE